MNKPCYALKLYTYDYHEFVEVCAVSFDIDALRSHYTSGLDRLFDDSPLVDEDTHKKLSDDEDPHWVIEEILFLKGGA